MWGTRWRQRLRLAPLYAAIRAADVLGRAGNARREGDARGGPIAAPRQPGIALVIPDRDAPAMLMDALASAYAALARVDEPHQVVVVTNGAAAAAYDDVRAAYPDVEFEHSGEPLGFSAAIARGLARVRHDWTYLMNNDVTLDIDALVHVAAHRGENVFSVSSQIFQRSADGRREETGFTDWYADRTGVHVFHAPVSAHADIAPHLAGSGGASLFRTASLVAYVRASRAYDPFYWEDIEWGVRAWRDGRSVLFCPASHAHHRHRVTTTRFYDAATIDRIVARNRCLFDARNRATRFGVGWLMNRVCDLDYRSQREMSDAGTANGVLRHRTAAVRADAPSPPVLLHPDRAAVELPPSSFSYRLRPASATRERLRLLIVTPFALFPPRHGGARRIAGLLAHLKHDLDIVLVSDEASLYDARSFAWFGGLCGVHLVQRIESSASGTDAGLGQRLRSHAHAALRGAVGHAIAEFAPDLVQIEYAELAHLVSERTPQSRWVLGLHDAYGSADFASAEEAGRFDADVVAAYDAVTVCSEEDLALLRQRRVVCVPNGSSVILGDYRPSQGHRLLFMGPFRYAPNLLGIRTFLTDVFPQVRAAFPRATILVLGGDGAAKIVAGDAAFAQAGVEVAGHRDDVPALLADSTLSVNPLTAIRGSSIKVIESLTAGRVVVSTEEGARGFRGQGLAGLVLVDSVAAMTGPIVDLLGDPVRRRRLEEPVPSILARHQWTHSATILRDLYRELAPRHRPESTEPSR